jgi:ABC-type cobalamin/Fe3+-siderophores transport system ATPase subunit
MTFGYALSQLTFSDGTVVPVPPNGLTVLVGANNVGKSQALKDIDQWIRLNAAGRVVADAVAARSGASAELQAWLDETCALTTQGASITFRKHAAAHELTNLVSWWGTYGALQGLADLVVLSLTTEERLRLTASVAPYDPIQSMPSAPLQILHWRSDHEDELSRTTSDVMGSGVTVSRVNFSQLHLYLGQIEPPPTLKPPPEYMEMLRSTPLVHDQGDGFRSFVGIMMSIITAQFPVMLIDEPEAFLHPPAARALGRELARRATDGVQVIVATHSLDFLLGALQNDTTLTVVRIDRQDSLNTPAMLDATALKEIWNDPLLRYSRILDGLFYTGVVLCEGDMDCRFYGAVLESHTGHDVSDVHFTHCGGKDRFVAAVRALRPLRVPLAVIADIDILNDSTKFVGLIEALGGERSVVARDLRIIDAAMSQANKRPRRDDVARRVDETINADRSEHLSSSELATLRAAVRHESPWDALKGAGRSAMPSGQPTTAFEAVTRYAESVGLFIVPVGECEGWIRSVGGRGPRWLAEVLAAGLHLGATEAATFIRGVEALVRSRATVAPAPTSGAELD